MLIIIQTPFFYTYTSELNLLVFLLVLNSILQKDLSIFVYWDE